MESCGLTQRCCPLGAQENFGTKSDSDITIERSQSDVYIDRKLTSVKDMGNHYYLETVVKCINDDNANHIELLINLPVENESNSFSGEMIANGTTESMDCNQCGHLIKCKTRTSSMGVNDEIKFMAKIGKPRHPSIDPTIGVTAISHFPADPKPENNTFYWRGGE